MKHLREFSIFENTESREIYGVFINTWQDKLALGLFTKESSIGLRKIIEDRFGFDGDDNTGSFGPLDISQPYLIFREDEFEILTGNNGEKEEWTIKFKIDPFIENIGKFYNTEEEKFQDPGDLFNEWYGDGDSLDPVKIAWQ